MAFQDAFNRRVRRWSVEGMEGMFCKMFDPPTYSPITPDLVNPTNPVPEVMHAVGLLDRPSTPHTIKPDLMHGLRIPSWDGAKQLMFFLIRDGDNDAAVGTFPGPTIRIPRGAIFHADTQGHGPPPHTIHWHGIEPTPMNDGVGHCSMEIGHYTYQFQPNFIGSYFYHCHRNTVQHFEFGLYGFLIIDPADAFFASLREDPGGSITLQGFPGKRYSVNPAIPLGAGRDGKRRTAANLRRVAQLDGNGAYVLRPDGSDLLLTDLTHIFPGFNANDPTAEDPEAGDADTPAHLQFPTDPHAMTVTYDLEALWVFDDRDSVWSDLAPDARATYPKHGNTPGVDDEFTRNPGSDGFFALNDFHADHWFVTGVPVHTHKGGIATLDRDITIPAGLMSGVQGTQVPIWVKNNPVTGSLDPKTVLLRCLNGAYNCVEITFPVDITIIAWDGRGLGVPPYGQYNHAYQVPAGTPLHLSVARRFDALIRADEEINAYATVKFIDTRGQVPDPGGEFPAEFSNDVLCTVRIPIDFGEHPDNPLFTISGTIRDEEGRPVDGVRVTAKPMSLGSMPLPAVFTDAAGAYTIANVTDGMYEVVPSATGLEFQAPGPVDPVTGQPTVQSFLRVTVADTNPAGVDFTAVMGHMKEDGDEAMKHALKGTQPDDPAMKEWLDVGPMKNGVPTPDGKVDLLDVVDILKKTSGGGGGH